MKNDSVWDEKLYPGAIIHLRVVAFSSVPLCFGIKLTLLCAYVQWGK